MDKWKIIYYTSPTGDNPVSDFLDTLNQQTQSKLLRILAYIKEYGKVLVLHGFNKKTQKTPPKELEIASKRYQQYLFSIKSH